MLTEGKSIDIIILENAQRGYFRHDLYAAHLRPAFCEECGVLQHSRNPAPGGKGKGKGYTPGEKAFDRDRGLPQFFRRGLYRGGSFFEVPCKRYGPRYERGRFCHPRKS